MKETLDQSTVLPCIVCGKKLRAVLEGEAQPYDAAVFRTQGGYGSSFDPMRGNVHLIVNICDECIAQKSKEHKVVISYSSTKTTYDNSYYGDDTLYED